MAKRKKRKPNISTEGGIELSGADGDILDIEGEDYAEEDPDVYVAPEDDEPTEAADDPGDEETSGAEASKELEEEPEADTFEDDSASDEEAVVIGADDGEQKRDSIFMTREDMEIVDLSESSADEENDFFAEADEEEQDREIVRKREERPAKGKSSKKKKRKKNSSVDLGEYIRDILASTGEWISENRVKLCRVLLVFLVLIIGFAAVNAMHRARQRASLEGDAVDLNSLSGNVIPIPVDAMKKDAYPKLNELVKNYFTAMQENDLYTYTKLRSQTDALEEAKLGAKSDYIEAYENICCYTKAGPYTDSYMVYVTYDLKLKDWDKTAPALVTLVVCTDENGELYVYSGSFEENVAEYIKGITSQEDVVELYNQVENEYKEVVEADASFREYMSALNQLIKDGVGERVAAARDTAAADTSAEEETDGGETANESETGAEGGEEANAEEPAEPEKPAEILVEATTNVNVRSSDSENADKLGKINEGTQLTCLEKRDNGWSRIQYEGKEAFVKTEFLKEVGATAQNAGEAEVIGTVTAKENINVRAAADTNSERLGLVNEGEKLEKLENDNNGWIKVKYNGKIGYVKSDYVK